MQLTPDRTCSDRRQFHGSIVLQCPREAWASTEPSLTASPSVCQKTKLTHSGQVDDAGFAAWPLGFTGRQRLSLAVRGSCRSSFGGGQSSTLALPAFAQCLGVCMRIRVMPSNMLRLPALNVRSTRAGTSGFRKRQHRSVSHGNDFAPPTPTFSPLGSFSCSLRFQTLL